MSAAQSKSFTVLPGFGTSLGYTLVYLSLIVLIPLAAIVVKTPEMDFATFEYRDLAAFAGQPPVVFCVFVGSGH